MLLNFSEEQLFRSLHETFIIKMIDEFYSAHVVTTWLTFIATFSKKGLNSLSASLSFNFTYEELRDDYTHQ